MCCVFVSLFQQLSLLDKVFFISPRLSLNNLTGNYYYIAGSKKTEGQFDAISGYWSTSGVWRWGADDGNVIFTDEWKHRFRLWSDYLPALELSLSASGLHVYTPLRLSTWTVDHSPGLLKVVSTNEQVQLADDLLRWTQQLSHWRSSRSTSDRGKPYFFYYFFRDSVEYAKNKNFYTFE